VFVFYCNYVNPACIAAIPNKRFSLTDFQTFFTDGLNRKFATNSYFKNIPPHLKYVATLPCEM